MQRRTDSKAIKFGFEASKAHVEGGLALYCPVCRLRQDQIPNDLKLKEEVYLMVWYLVVLIHILAPMDLRLPDLGRSQKMMSLS